MADKTDDLTLLLQLLEIDGPSGDEGAMADWLEQYVGSNYQDASMERLGDSLVVSRGDLPTVAVFAHIDTTGYTLGYDKQLIPIGGPAPKPHDMLRSVGGPNAGNRIKQRKRGAWKLGGATDAAPGSRWVYAEKPVLEDGTITSPYLDNRAGVWAALQALARCQRIAVAFTVGEEHSGQGAFVCARRLYEKFGIVQALISDITWDTSHVHCGGGVAISLRDRMMPRQRFLDQILSLADKSGLPYQREIETGGGSDGSSIERSGLPISWVFVGAPEKKPHTSAERLTVSDLSGMAGMLSYLVDALSGEPAQTDLPAL